MIAFFDTAVHIEIMLGRLSLDEALAAVANVSVRMSPIVASELLRGSTGRTRRAVDRLVGQLLTVEPPSWRRCWWDAGRVLPSIFADHEEIGQARLQNDCLLALTARHTGAILLTSDRHFETIRRRVAFRLRTFEPSF